MSKNRKAGVVDSYAAIKALQRAGTAHPAATTPTESHTPAGKTVLPPKQVIECYECGYKFQLHGRAPTTNCNKCRKILDLTDHTIDQRWTGILKTAGTVRVASDGVIESGEIVTNDFILEGTIESGTVRAMRRLELHPGARFSELNLTAPNLLIAAGANIALTEPAEYRDVEIHGALRANLHTTGLVTIRTTGSFEGKLATSHLAVEDGGGLCAALQVTAT